MISLNDLLAAGGQLHGAPRADTFADISSDSRLTRPGELFLALRTPHADGHDFIAAALAAGATGVVCTWPPESADATIILADDPAALIQRWAARRLAAVAPLVVGVTGSVGKTSTVRAIATLLRQLGPAFHSCGQARPTGQPGCGSIWTRLGTMSAGCARSPACR